MESIAGLLVLFLFFAVFVYVSFTFYRERLFPPKPPKKEREGDGPNDTRYKKPAKLIPKEGPKEGPKERNEKRSA